MDADPVPQPAPASPRVPVAVRLGRVRVLRGPNPFGAWPALLLQPEPDPASVPAPGLRPGARLLRWLSDDVTAPNAELNRWVSGFAHVLPSIDPAARYRLALGVLLHLAHEPGRPRVLRRPAGAILVPFVVETSAVRAARHAALLLDLAALAAPDADVDRQVHRALADLRRRAAADRPHPALVALAAAAARRGVPAWSPVRGGHALQLGYGANGRRVVPGALGPGAAADHALAGLAGNRRDLLAAARVPVLHRVAVVPDLVAATAAKFGGPVRLSGPGGERSVTPGPGPRARAALARAVSAVVAPLAGDPLPTAAIIVAIEDARPGERQRVYVVGGRAIGMVAPAASRLAPVPAPARVVAERAARVLGAGFLAVDLAGAGTAAKPGAAPLVVDAEPEPAFPEGAAGAAVAAALVDAHFPARGDGRIPLIAVTGTNGKTTTTRLIAHLLRAAFGPGVGLTTTDGVDLDGVPVFRGDCSGPQSARILLLDPAVTMAVLETARGGILRAGLGWDHCQIAVVTNVAADHLGLDGVETEDDVARIKRVVPERVLPGGAAVLNADDRRVAAMARRTPGEVIFFGFDPASPTIAAHLAAGGRAVSARDGAVTLHRGAAATPLLPLAEVPLTLGGAVRFQNANVLAAAAAAWAMEVAPETMAAALRSFSSSPELTPGRMNLLDVHGRRVLIDYGHNPHALAALAAAIPALRPAPEPGHPPGRAIALFGAPGDRRDRDLRDLGRLLGESFDLVVLREGAYRRGRPEGQIVALLRDGIAAAVAASGRSVELHEVEPEADAVRAALDRSAPGDLVVLIPDHAALALEVVRTWTPPPISVQAPAVPPAQSSVLSPQSSPVLPPSQETR